MVSNGSGNKKIVEAVGLTKVFSDFWFRAKARAVDGIDFSIEQNEIFGLLGPNGSGKSTTIKMILGLLRKSRGRLAVFGKEPSDVSIKSRIGYLPEETYMYRFLDARETLDYYGKLFGLDRRIRKKRVEELLDMVGLSQVAHRKVGEYSKGMARRIGLAQALINDPDLIVLDEPTSGLDPIGCREIKDLILTLAERGKTVILSSHLLADVEDVCDRAMILYGGRVQAIGTMKELLSDRNATRITSPALSRQTMDHVLKLIREDTQSQEVHVDNPTQNLENLFLNIVEQARKKESETSGATSGHRVAEYLRGKAGENQADRVLDHLTRSEKPIPSQDQAPRPTTPAVDEDKLASLAQRDKNDAIEKTSVPKKEENIDSGQKN